MVMAAALLACAVLLTAPQGPAPAPQAPAAHPPAAAEQSTVSADDLPVSIDRIQRALAGPPQIQLKEQHPIFRLEIFGRKPTLEDVLGERFWIGPTPYGGMTHQDFLDMVTPKLNQPYAGFTGKYLAAQVAQTLFQQWMLKAALRHFRDATSDADREAARREVVEALAALEAARRSRQ